MLTFNRGDRPNDLKDPKLSNRLAPLAPQPAAGTPLPASPPRTAVPPAVPEPPVLTATAADMPGSRLSIGVNINLKGVEISNCDVLLIEGNVEATINSKAMEIAKPGRLSGTAIIDVAEIHGEFSGELTARGKLIVHGTGRVTGTIRYGKLVVAEGGTVNGELKQLDAAPETKPATPAPNSPPLLNPYPH
jgi:cytoskeletal protein CcmA (bactofilin family)